MREQLRHWLKGMGSNLNLYPGVGDMPKELHRYMEQPKTVEEAFLADAKALRQDWERVEQSLCHSIGVHHARTR